MLKAAQKVRERHALRGQPDQSIRNVVEEIARMVEGHSYQEGLRGWPLEPNGLASSYNRAEGSDVAIHSMALGAAIRRKFLHATSLSEPRHGLETGEAKPHKALGSPHVTTDLKLSTRQNAYHSMHRHSFGAEHVEHDSQSNRHLFSQQGHGKSLDAVSEARLDDDDGPAIVGFLNGAIDGIGSDHLGLRDNARVQESLSHRESGDTSHVAQTSTKDTPAFQKPTPALSQWSGWDESNLPWSRAKHQDAVCRAVFGPTWSTEDAAALIGFINCTWGPSPSPHVHLSCPERSRAVPENRHITYDNAQTPSPHVEGQNNG